MKFEQKHTAGRWHAVGALVEHENDDIPDICNCSLESMGQEDMGRKYDEICANARLMAAAPEMLDLLCKFSKSPYVSSQIAEEAMSLIIKITR